MALMRRLSLQLTLLILSALSFSSSSSSSAALSTVAISHVGNSTLVCALLPSRSAADRYDLNCTAYPSGKTRHYPSTDVSFSAITAGDGFLCALGSSSPSSSSSVMLWWDFAHNTHSSSSIPDAKKVYQGPPVASLSAGDSHVCGLTGASRSPYCWRWPHLPIPDGLNATDIAVGGDFLCGLLGNGTIACFGGDAAGVVGREPPGRHVRLAAGSSHACGLSANNELVCWGAGAPKAAKGPAPVDSLALGNNRTCALYASGRVVCWGENAALPKDVAGAQFMAVEARGDAFCGVLLLNYSLVCWGSEVFRRKQVVFRQVLPGTCAPVSSCSCGVVPGSGTLCADGAICRTCSRQSGVNQPQLNSPTTPDNGRRVHDKRRLIFLLLGSIGIGLGTLVAALFFFYFRFGHRGGRVHDWARLNPRTPPTRANAASPTVRHGQESGIDRQLSQFLSKGHGAAIEEFPIKLLLEITDGFSEEHKIGSGSFGSVYRAKLADGRAVAIKRAEPSSRASTSRARTPTASGNCRESAFVAEVALLSRVNHRNLVRLLGYCRDGPERILVYEFMSNGSLHSLLHTPDPRGPDSPLGSWPARIRVALDAARGIDYLHTYAVPPIIHRDIKSSNILLEEDWTAKVSDFGLSLMTPDPAAAATTEDYEWSSGSFCTAGTVGYMDPEYYRLQHLNAKSDVYSFGVVLLEILSGRKVIERYGTSESPKNVVELVVPRIVADDMPGVLDRRLPPPTPSEAEAVAFVGYLAADSVSPEGRGRPTMTEIVNGLERALAACAPRASTSRSTSVDSG